MADAQRDLKIVINEDHGQAESGLKSFGDSLKNVGEIAAGLGLERVAEQILEIGKEAADFAVQTAARFEQTATSFQTILGSSKAAGELLKSLSDWEVHTPFTFEQITNASKEMLAFGAKAQDVLPNLKKLSDVSMGDPARLQELVSIWGEVNSMQEVNSRTILRLSSIGVPIFPALEEVMKKAGVAGAGMGTHIEKGTKMSAESMQSLNDRIKETKDHITQLGDGHGLAGKKLATYNHEIMVSSDRLNEYQTKLAGANKVVQNVGASSEMSAKQIREMLRAGQVTPEMFNEAMDVLTEKGGMFFNETQRQSLTFNGVMSSIHSQFQRLALDIMGVSLEGDIEKDGLFAKLKDAAFAFFDFISANKDNIANNIKRIISVIEELAGTFQRIANISQPLINAVIFATARMHQIWSSHRDEVIGVITFFHDRVKQLWNKHKDDVIYIVNFFTNQLKSLWKSMEPALIDALKLLGAAMVVFFEFAKAAWQTWGKDLWLIIKGIFEVIIGVLKLTFDLFHLLFKTFSDVFHGRWTTFWTDIKDVVKRVVDDITEILHGLFNFISGGLKAMTDGLNNFAPNIVNNFASKLPHKALGGVASGLTVVGERGPELVNLPNGSYVHSNDDSRQMMGGGITVNVNNPSVRSDNDIKAIVDQVIRALGRNAELARLGAI